MTRRDLLALLVIVVGGTLWLVLPAESGSLRDRSAPVRWPVSPGRSLAAWVLVSNPGLDRIELEAVTLGSALPRGGRLLGTAARRGHFPAVDDRWPSGNAAFRPIDGYVIEPGTKATIALGLLLPAGRFRLSGVRIDYRQDGAEHDLKIGAPAVLCVKVSPRAC